jgi:hypothetical protein
MAVVARCLDHFDIIEDAGIGVVEPIVARNFVTNCCDVSLPPFAAMTFDAVFTRPV